MNQWYAGKTRVLKVVIWVIGLCEAGYVVGPSLYWHFIEGIAAVRRASSSRPSCRCDCSSNPLLSIHEGLNNDSFTDCMKRYPEVSEEMEKSFSDLFSEELKLKEAKAKENQKRADMTLLEAKKMASQFQKEADKCNSGMETCEEAREKADAALEEQRRVTEMWELRARQRGWKEGSFRSHA